MTLTSPEVTMLKCFKGTNKVLWGPKKGQLVLPAEGSVLEE